MTIDKTIATLAANMSDRNRDWFLRSVYGAVCDNTDWNLKQKRELMSKVRGEIKELLAEPSNEITLANTGKKVAFYDELEEAERAFEQLHTIFLELYAKATGETWKPRARNGRNLDAESLTALRDRFA